MWMAVMVVAGLTYILMELLAKPGIPKGPWFCVLLATEITSAELMNAPAVIAWMIGAAIFIATRTVHRRTA